jgi:hypothetical protein
MLLIERALVFIVLTQDTPSCSFLSGDMLFQFSWFTALTKEWRGYYITFIFQSGYHRWFSNTLQ